MNICVFSSSSNGIDQGYFEEANQLGTLIGKRGHTLINGGANVGLMEAVTIAAKNRGARTIGIIPQQMQKRNLVSENSHEVIITDNMQERKASMRNMSDAFIALPGGFGTLEEILEVLTLKQLAYHNKPVVFINTKKFFEYLLLQFEKSYTEYFAKEAYRDLYFIAKNSETAITYIETYQPVAQVSKWFKVPEKKDR
jgi:cytokinin riboside 5'-monophosphate phosphoribohydrolase